MTGDTRSNSYHEAVPWPEVISLTHVLSLTLGLSGSVALTGAAVLLSAVFSVVSVFAAAGCVSTDAELETRARAAAAVVCGTGECCIPLLVSLTA